MTTEQVRKMIVALAIDIEYVRIEALATALESPVPIILSHLRILEMFGHITYDTVNNQVKPTEQD